MSKEQRLEKLKVEHEKYEKELEELQLSVENDKQYEDSSVSIDKELARIRGNLDKSHSKILNLQDKIALELKARRL